MVMKLKLSSILTLIAVGFLLLSTAGSSAQENPIITGIPSLGGSEMSVNGLNDSGQVTGFSWTAGDNESHAFLFSAHGLADLGTLGGGVSSGNAINALGQIAGSSTISVDDYWGHAFLYDASGLHDLGVLGGYYSRAIDINDAGLICGDSDSSSSSGSYEAFVYANGVLTGLGDLGGGSSKAVAINERGTVIGYSSTTNLESHGFLYKDLQMIDLGTLGGTYSYAAAINNSDMIVGESENETNGLRAFLYSGGAMTDLGTLGGSESSATGINDLGQVIGTATTPAEATHGFIYADGVMTDLGTLGGTNTEPSAINNSGQVVGCSKTATDAWHAFLWQKGVITDLNTLLPPDSGWELTDAWFINTSGQIVGYGILNGASAWFLMNPRFLNRAPTAEAGPDQTVECGATVTLDGTASSDPDGDALTYQWSEAGVVLGTGATLTPSFALGTHLLSLKVTDPSGAFGEDTVIVTVVDTTPPMLATPVNATASADGTCQAGVPDFLARLIVADTCARREALNISQDPPAGSLVGLGPHPVTIEASDPSGNTSKCTVLFTVADTTPPTLSTPANATASADETCQAAVPDFLAGLSVADNCASREALTISQDPPAGSLVGIGRLPVTIVARDPSGNTSECTVFFTVADTTPPTLSTPANATASADETCQAAVPDFLAGLSVADNCAPREALTISQSPAAGTLVGLGAHSIAIVASDLSGNTSTRTVLFTVVETTPPVITSVTATPDTLTQPNKQLVPVVVSVIASDNCGSAPVNTIQSVTCNEQVSDGDIQITGPLTVALAASRDPSGAGRVYTITIQSVDASGNISTGSVDVVVPKGHKDGGKPAHVVR